MLANNINSLMKSNSEPNLPTFFQSRPKPQTKIDTRPGSQVTVDLAPASFNLMAALYDELKLNNALEIEKLLSRKQEKESEQKEQKEHNAKFEQEIRHRLYT